MRGFSALSDGLRSFMLPTLSETSRPPTKYLAHRFPRYPDALREEDFPLGIEHFLEYLEASDVFDNTRLVPTRRELDVLEEGERVYTAPIHSQLEDDWYEDRISLDQISERYARGRNNAPFETLLLPFKYPVLEHRLLAEVSMSRC